MRSRCLAGVVLALSLSVASAALGQGRVVSAYSGPLTQTGATAGRVIVAASTNCSSLKGSAAILYGITGWATNNQWNYIRLYDLAAAPTANVSTVSHMYGLFGASGGAVLNNPVPPTGIAFPNGLGICVTGAGTATDNTSAVGGAVVNYSFK